MAARQDHLQRAHAAQRDLPRFVNDAVATAAQLTRAGERRDKWLLLQDLETQTKERFQAHLAATGQRASLPALVGLRGRISGALLALLPWSIAMKMLGDATAPFLVVFERLERNAGDAAKAFFSYVVAHERAIAAFARLEREGRPDASSAPVTSLLEQPERGPVAARAAH